MKWKKQKKKNPAAYHVFGHHAVKINEKKLPKY